MSKKTVKQGPIARTNNLINNHKVASSVIAGSLLASVSFVSAAAINLSGQIAKDAYSYPATSLPVNHDKDQDTPKTDEVTNQPVENNDESQVQGAVYNAPAVAAPAPVVTLASTPAAPIAAEPVVAAPVVPTPVEPQPVEEEPVDETPVDPQPAFSVQITEIDALGARFVQIFEDDETLYRIDAGLVEVAFDEDYMGEYLEASASVVSQPEGSEAECVIDPDKPVVYLFMPEGSAPGEYVCEVTLTDGTVTRSGQFIVTVPAVQAV